MNLRIAGSWTEISRMRTSVVMSGSRLPWSQKNGGQKAVKSTLKSKITLKKPYKPLVQAA